MLKQFVFLLVFFAITANANEPLDKVVAVVNNDVITASEINAEVTRLRQQLVAKGMEVPSDATLRKEVLQHLIGVDLELQLAKQNNITVDSEDLDEAISKIAATNHLSLSRLREEIHKQGLSWKTYRETIRKEMLIGRLQQKAVAKDIQVSNQQVEDYIKTSQYDDKAQQTYHLHTLLVPLSEEPTTEQVKSAQQKAKDLLLKSKQGKTLKQLAVTQSSDEFTLEESDLGERHLAELPEIFAQFAAQMKLGEVAGPIRAGNGYHVIKLIAIGSNHQAHIVTKTHVRHILIKPDAQMPTAEAETQAENVYQQLKAGKDFSVMAKQYSSDSASAIKGGNLGWVNPGELVPEFEKAMDALPVNKVSKPIKSGFGWHIIEVLARKKVDDSESFKRQQARQFLQHRKFTEAIQNWQQHLRAEAYVNIIDKELA